MTANQVRCAYRLIFGLALCAWSAVAAASSTSVTALVLPKGPYSEVAVREMGREAATILKQSGVSLHWMVGAPSQSVDGWLVVVKLDGNCDMDGSTAQLVPGPLGWSHEVNGDVLPFSDLACDNLRGAVEAAVHDARRMHANVLLGRAMGRVLAHELYHILADTPEHSRDGVAQAALTPRELTSGPLQLEPAENKAIESALNAER